MFRRYISQASINGGGPLDLYTLPSSHTFKLAAAAVQFFRSPAPPPHQALSLLFPAPEPLLFLLFFFRVVLVLFTKITLGLLTPLIFAFILVYLDKKKVFLCFF
jgi:hypothetical protein